VDPNQLPLDIFEFDRTTEIVTLKGNWVIDALPADATFTNLTVTNTIVGSINGNAATADHADTADSATNATNAGNADTVDNAHADVAPTAGEIPILNGVGLGAFGITGNAATATSATSAGNADTVDGAHADVAPTTGEIPILDGDGKGAFSITGAAATAVRSAAADAVKVEDEASDTSCYPLFVPAATGDLIPKTDAALAYDPTIGLLGVTGIALGGGATANMTSGEYTPTFTFGTANMTAANQRAFYIQFAGKVFVYGSVDLVSSVAATLNGTVGISLPIASNFSNVTDLAGHMIRNFATTSDNFEASIANDCAQSTGTTLTSVQGGGLGYTFSFMYTVQ
jgi:hypothetical protein